MSIAQQIPLSFRLSPLPQIDMTPQEFADAIVARLTAESTNTISFFASGSVAPTSNVGPWLKDGTTWYVWSDSLGMYVPQVLTGTQLGYIAQQAPGPDHTIYTFWIQLDGAGKAQSIQYYSASAWHNVYEDTFANIPTNATMAAAIAAAVGGATTKAYPVLATEPSNQTIGVTGAYQKLVLTKDIDPNLAFDDTLSRYTAPVAGVYRFSAYNQVDNSTGDASGMEIGVALYKNGTILAGAGQGTAVSNPPGMRWYVNLSTLTQLAANDYIELWLFAQDGTNTGNVIASASNFAIELVQAS